MMGGIHCYVSNCLPLMSHYTMYRQRRGIIGGLIKEATPILGNLITSEEVSNTKNTLYDV